jgi:hypothetical protein
MNTPPQKLRNEGHLGFRRKKGHIGFLGHTGRVEFRDIRVKDLSGHNTKDVGKCIREKP